jgi:hypothetical protein
MDRCLRGCRWGRKMVAGGCRFAGCFSGAAGAPGFWIAGCCAGAAREDSRKEGGADRCRAGFIAGFPNFVSRNDLLNSSASSTCASPSRESAASITSPLAFRSSSSPVSPRLFPTLTRIHVPPLNTSEPVSDRDEILATPENFSPFSSFRRLSTATAFLISRNVPLGSCIIVSCAMQEYIISF